MSTKSVDVLLIGAGAMGTTLGMLLQQLDPSLKVCMVERLDHVARESTDGWNNAGTGHSAYCELNYTPQQSDGSIDTQKAFRINESFEISLQFWSHLVENGILANPRDFIHTTPHMSLVWGKDNVEFLKKRHATLSQHAQFKDMEFSEDPAQLAEWMPLVMNNRDSNEPLAATRVRYGSDVNFGALARNMANYLKQQDNFDLMLGEEVTDLEQQSDKSWQVDLRNRNSGARQQINARFVFIGAGGRSLPLLQKSGVEEAKGYGGFPVSGEWLICRKPEIVNQHHAKVYGKASIGAPPMSVPHLDTRIIDGEKAILFGPFAGATTKFLKTGSIWDFPKSISFSNLMPIMSVGMHNMSLVTYLVGQVMQSHADRVKQLQDFYPEAKKEDWELGVAGQRVQIIKKGPNGGGNLQFGTEVIMAKDNSLAALLGASPGASTATKTMIGIIEQCFIAGQNRTDWKARMKELIPSYGESLHDNPDLLKKTRARTLRVMQLDTQYAEELQQEEETTASA